MSFIEKSVARLDQMERLEVLALELGKGHYHYNAPPKYYSVRQSFTDIYTYSIYNSFQFRDSP